MLLRCCVNPNSVSSWLKWELEECDVEVVGHLHWKSNRANLWACWSSYYFLRVSIMKWDEKRNILAINCKQWGQVSNLSVVNWHRNNQIQAFVNNISNNKFLAKNIASKCWLCAARIYSDILLSTELQTFDTLNNSSPSLWFILFATARKTLKVWR